MFSYEIGGKKYIQKPLVLGQIQQLMNVIKGVTFGALEPLAIVAALGDKLSEAIAVVLCEEGKTLKDKDIPKLASEIQFELSPEQTIKVIEDFFDCNPIASLLERLTGMAEKISNTMTSSKKTGLEKSSASSAEEISPKETASSGDIA